MTLSKTTLTGLLSLCLDGCVRHFVVECPPIPAVLTEPCALPDSSLQTNGDLAQALLEARSCLREERVKLAAIEALAACRT